MGWQGAEWHVAPAVVLAVAGPGGEDLSFRQPASHTSLWVVWDLDERPNGTEGKGHQVTLRS